MKKSFLIVLVLSLCFACSDDKPSTNANELFYSQAQIKKVESVHNVASVANAENGVDCASIQSSEDKPQTPVSSLPDLVQKTVEKKKIIRDGSLIVQVSNLLDAKKQVDSLVKKWNAYYSSENLQNNNNESGYQLVIRIPVVNFDRFLTNSEKSLGKVLNKQVSARDVTEQFIDLETRLKSKRNSLERYNVLILKASSMKDIIEIQEAIRTLQEEIESTEGRLRYLTDCVEYSTLTLTISTQKDFVYQPRKRDSFIEKVKEQLAEGWFSMVDFFLDLFGAWPLIIISVVVFFIVRHAIRKYVKRWRKKKTTQES